MKRTVLFLLAAAFFVSHVSCVSTSEHKKLKNEHAGLESRYTDIQYENEKLRKKNKELQAELKKLQQTADYHYKQGMAHLKKKEYEKARTAFKTVLDEYPASQLCDSAQKQLAVIHQAAKDNYAAILTDLKAKQKIREKLACIDRQLKDRYLTKQYRQKLEARKKALKARIPAVEVVRYKLVKGKQHEKYSDYNDRVKFFLQCKNNTDKTVLGIAYHVKFLDSFNETLYEFETKWNVRIQPNSKNPMDTYMYWDDNQFIENETYDKLSVPIKENTVKTQITIKKVVFDKSSTRSKTLEYTKNPKTVEALFASLEYAIKKGSLKMARSLYTPESQAKIKTSDPALTGDTVDGQIKFEIEQRKQNRSRPLDYSANGNKYDVTFPNGKTMRGVVVVKIDGCYRIDVLKSPNGDMLML